MQQDRLSVEIFKLAVFLRCDRKEFQLRQLKDDTDRGLRFLHGRIGGAEPDIHLAAEDCLNGQFLVCERSPLVFEAVRLGTVQRNKEGCNLVRRRFGQCDPDLTRLRA